MSDPQPESKFNVTMAASEIVPFAKTGGLADMAGALSGALAASGMKINLVMPAYRPILREIIGTLKASRIIRVTVGGRLVTGRLYKKRLTKMLNIYFVRADEFFDRDHLYGNYPDNAERFAFFSRAVLEVAGVNRSDIIHLHDWQTAPAAAFLKMQPERYPELSEAKTIVTTHNLAYQGLFSRDCFSALDFNPGSFNSSPFEFWGELNFLKSGLATADRLTTVSPTYSREIQQDGCGFGLEGVLRERSRDLTGILNGVDYGVWNPETDPHIKRRYSAVKLAGKTSCKLDLQQSYGLDRDRAAPLMCMVTRLADGKGLELVMETIEVLLAEGIQFALLGSGDRRYEEFFQSLALRWPGKLGVKIAFDEAFAHRTIAGADMLLMPSLHEPCGLTQMYALKYGAIPIVRCTGGLADSIEPYNETAGTGNGFLFQDYSGVELLDTIRRGLAVYKRKKEWRVLARRAMAADHSWRRSMEAYLRLYRELVNEDVTAK